MDIPTYVLLLLGCLGAADIALFHSVAHGIRSHADSVAELVTHSLRGPTYAALFLLIPNFEMRGLFAWGLMALFIFDVGISIVDFALEQGSRRFLGGLPSGEYVLHMLMAIVFGALVATILCFGKHWFSLPTRLVYTPVGVPVIVRLALSVMAVGVLISGIQDATAALRLRKLGRRRFAAAQARDTRQHQDSLTEKLEPAPKCVAAPRMQKVPGWMRLVLNGAGFYNLVWGAWVVLFPSALFRWGGMPPNNYPEIWQCVGMIVGVYGIGYMIAARDPFKHWPIILVGLLGKVLGPIGMAWSVVHGNLLPAMAWTCVPNDLLWWLPFALVLLRVMQKETSQGGSQARKLGISG